MFDFMLISFNFYSPNDFEEKELIEEGEVVDPMAIQQLEESEEEMDAVEQKQDDLQANEVQVDEALNYYLEMNHQQ